MSGFDLVYCRVDQATEFFALFFGYFGFEILDFRSVFADKHYESDIGNTREPGIANQLRVQCKQALSGVGVASTGRFPINDATFSIQFADGVHVTKEFCFFSKFMQNLDLEIILRIFDAHAVILGKATQ